jgi:hypothetical protein
MIQAINDAPEYLSTCSCDLQNSNPIVLPSNTKNNNKMANINPKTEPEKMAQAQEYRYPPPGFPTLEPEPKVLPAPPTKLDNLTPTLLYNITTKMLAYITMAQLYELPSNKRVHSTYVPMWTRRMDIVTGARGIGTSGHKLAGTLWLPSLVVFWRLLGWYSVLWLIEGEDV